MSAPRTPLEKFTRWYIEPFEKIKEVEGGGGAVVAMSIGLMLCERYFRSLTNTQDDACSEANRKFRNKAAEVLGVNSTFFRHFWTIYRHGIQHQGMIKTTTLDGILYSWLLDGKYPSLPCKVVINGISCICINPWGWTKRIIDLWLADPERMAEQTTHRLGSVFEVSHPEPILYPTGSSYP
jgi:hypothetical protein